MRRAVSIIAVVCVVGIALGTWFFVTQSKNTQGEVSFSTIQQGTNALGVSERKNYRIKSPEELSYLWSVVYDVDGPDMPEIDFTKQHVLAVFDGSRPSGGYEVAVEKIIDTQAARTVTIKHRVPDDSCMVSQAITSPFAFVVVPASALPIVREDVEEVYRCE